MDTLPDQVSQLVSILTHHGHTHSSGPVEVKMGQLVGQNLDSLGLPSTCIFNHVVGRWVDCALAHRLRDEVEVIPFRQGDDIIKNGSTGRVNVITLSGSSFLVEFPAKEDLP